MLKSSYTDHRKAKRWWLRLFWYLADTSVVNFFILCCHINLANAAKLKRVSDECSSRVTGNKLDACLSAQHCVCVEKKNQLDATEWFIALIIRSICFRHFYAHHQELKTICVLLPPMVCNAVRVKRYN